MTGSLYAAVLRSHLGLKDNRPKLLNDCDENLQRRRHFYDLISVFNFEKKSREYFENQLEYIFDNYETFSSNDEFSERGCFCSAFVVACYSAVGVVGRTAQCAYPTNFFSPAGLYKDSTFGWLLGFLLGENEEGFLIEDDPILKEGTLWQDCMDISTRWW